MPLIGTTGAASVKGFGFFRKTSVGIYYYSLALVDENYSPVFQNPVVFSGGGWAFAGRRDSPSAGASNKRFIVTLNSLGNVTNYVQDSGGGPQPYLGFLLSNGNYAFNYQSTVGYISPSLSYTGTRKVPANPTSSVSPIAADGNNIYVNGVYDDGTSTWINLASMNADTTTNWTKRFAANGGSWSSAKFVVVRPNDATNVLVVGKFNSKLGAFLLNKSTAAVSSGIGYSTTQFDNVNAAFSDSSGNVYIGSTSGSLMKINSSNSIVWQYTYTKTTTGSNFGYMDGAFYNNKIYFTGSQHPDGFYLVRIDPNTGDVEWSVEINNSAFYSGTGIAAGPDGLLICGNNNPNTNAYVLNYPLAGGVYGTYGAFSFSTLGVTKTNPGGSFSAQSAPSLTNIYDGNTSTYGTSLVTGTNPMSQKFSY
jgi:hypothetical protein